MDYSQLRSFYQYKLLGSLHYSLLALLHPRSDLCLVAVLSWIKQLVFEVIGFLRLDFC